MLNVGRCTLMPAASSRSVANPPAKPVLLFDGDCHFCRRWIERWRGMTGDRVEYVAAQESGARFPEIAPEEYQRAVQFVDADGRISSGAEAVFRSLGAAPRASWLRWSYEKVPGFAGLTEAAYKGVAGNRQFASAGTRLLWGNEVRRPTYFTSRQLFVRMLGLIYLIAFVSLWTQIDGLVGSEGISPVGQYLSYAREQLGDRA